MIRAQKPCRRGLNPCSHSSKKSCNFSIASSKEISANSSATRQNRGPAERKSWFSRTPTARNIYRANTMALGRNQHQIVLVIGTISDEYQLGRNGCIVQFPTANFNGNTQQIPRAATALFASGIDLFTGSFFPLKGIVDFAALFHHGYNMQILFPHGSDYFWRRKPTVKENILCLDSSGLSLGNQIRDDFCPLFYGQFSHFCTITARIQTFPFGEAILLNLMCTMVTFAQKYLGSVL